jgi:hypothetical protein
MTIPLTMGENTVTLTPANPVAYYSITVDSPIKIYSSGSYDTYCTLSNILEQTWTYDDEGVDANFELTISVNGSYFLDITLFGGAVSETTTFTVTVEPYSLATDSQLNLYARLTENLDFNLPLLNAFAFEDDFIFYIRLTDTYDYEYVLSNYLVSESNLNLSTALVAESRLLLSVRPIEITDNAILFSSPLINIQDSQLSMTAELLQYRLTDSQLTLSVNLEAEYQSLVIDIHNPETPVYGEYL